MTCGGHYCAKCKYDNGKGDDRCGLKGCKIARYALDLIIRQQAEIENLKVENQSLRGAANSFKMHYEKAQAEIERLNKENKNLLCKLCKKVNNESKAIEKLIKSEAVKEFAERLKEKKQEVFTSVNITELAVTEWTIDNLVKEMVGENND